MKRRKFLSLATGSIASSIALSSCSRPRLSQSAIDRLLYELNSGEALAASNEITQEQLESIALRGFMLTIFWAEGTYPNPIGADPYKILFGYGLFDSFAKHPDVCVPIPGSDLCSTAAGIFQFITTTWDAMVARYPDAFDKTIEGFAPKNQEVGGALLIGECGAYWELIKGVKVEGDRVVVPKDSFVRAAWKAASQWASFPLENGDSIGKNYGGQSARPLEDLWAYFQEVLNDF